MKRWLRTRRVIDVCVLSILLVIAGCREREPAAVNQPTEAAHKQDLPTLTVGIQVSPAMALVMVAKDKGFFDKAGVNVQIKEFTAGKFALQAFLGGSLDVAISGEVPVTLSILQGNRFRVITQVVERTINECRVVVRKEPGLDTPERYFQAERRKLATSFGGGPEFFTYSFLKKHGIGQGQVELISQKPEDMPAALVSGSVDAISVFDPQARIAERTMGDKGQTFADADIYSELYVVDVMQKTVDGRRADLIAFLTGLREAALYIDQHPAEAKAVVVKYTKLEPVVVDDIWANFVFRPVLNNLFLTYTAAEAKWAIDKRTFPVGTPIPDYKTVTYPDLLRSIDPKAVSDDYK